MDLISSAFLSTSSLLSRTSYSSEEEEVKEKKKKKKEKKLFFLFFLGSVASGVPNMWGLFRWNKDKQELTRVFLEQNGTNVVTNGAIAPNGKVVAIGRGRECLLVEIKGDSVGETRKFESEEESEKPKSEDGKLIGKSVKKTKRDSNSVFKR